MALYVIADLHLSLDSDKAMDVFRGWENYVSRLEKHWRAIVKEEDTVVIAGDISWVATTNLVTSFILVPGVTL